MKNSFIIAEMVGLHDGSFDLLEKIIIKTKQSYRERRDYLVNLLIPKYLDFKFASTVSASQEENDFR